MPALVALHVGAALLLAGCGSVLAGPDDEPPAQPAVTAPADLPAPVASAPRVGAASKTNWLTGEDVPDGRVLAVKVDNTASARPQAGLTAADVVYVEEVDRKSTRLNSSHGYISYAVFCLKKKKKKQIDNTHVICE